MGGLVGVAITAAFVFMAAVHILTPATQYQYTRAPDLEALYSVPHLNGASLDASHATLLGEQGSVTTGDCSYVTGVTATTRLDTLQVRTTQAGGFTSLGATTLTYVDGGQVVAAGGEVQAAETSGGYRQCPLRRLLGRTTHLTAFLHSIPKTGIRLGRALTPL